MTRVRVTPPAMVTLYDRVTGQRLERWPVDAAELLATGGYTTDPIAPAPADSVPVPSVVEPPPGMVAAPAPAEAGKKARRSSTRSV
jgi:hypothetical protein